MEWFMVCNLFLVKKIVIDGIILQKSRSFFQQKTAIRLPGGQSERTGTIGNERESEPGKLIEELLLFTFRYRHMRAIHHGHHPLAVKFSDVRQIDQVRFVHCKKAIFLQEFAEFAQVVGGYDTLCILHHHPGTFLESFAADDLVGWNKFKTIHGGNPDAVVHVTGMEEVVQ